VNARWHDDEVAPPPRPAPRGLAIALALAAAACMVAACFSHRWLTNRHRGDVGYSPLSFQICQPTCVAISNFQVADSANESPFRAHRVAAAFPVTGLVTFLVLLLAAAGLVAAAALAALNLRPELPVSPTTIALLAAMVALVTGCVFVATKPGPVGGVGVGWGFWAFGVGAVAGIGGAQLLARQIRPADPDLLHDTMNADPF
jgi:hypothetical protein